MCLCVWPAVQGVVTVVPQSQSAESVAVRQATGFEIGLHLKGTCATCKSPFKYRVGGSDLFEAGEQYTRGNVDECRRTGLCIPCNISVSKARAGNRDVAYEFECRRCRQLFNFPLPDAYCWAGFQHACDACAHLDAQAGHAALSMVQRVRAECQAENARKRAAFLGEEEVVDFALLDAQVDAHMQQRAQPMPPPRHVVEVVAPVPGCNDAPDHEAVCTERSAATPSGVAAEPSVTVTSLAGDDKVKDGQAEDGGAAAS